MKIAIYRVGKGKVKWADRASELWLSRIQHRFSVAEICIKPSPDKGCVAQRKAEETKRLMGKIQVSDRLIVLDERGETKTTEQLRDWVENAMNTVVKRLVFAIGGPFGHDEEIYSRAWKTLRLSSMVLNHELARVVLSEQLYRVHTLIWGGAYHH